MTGTKVINNAADIFRLVVHVSFAQYLHRIIEIIGSVQKQKGEDGDQIFPAVEIAEKSKNCPSVFTFQGDVHTITLKKEFDMLVVPVALIVQNDDEKRTVSGCLFDAVDIQFFVAYQCTKALNGRAVQIGPTAKLQQLNFFLR